MGSLDSEIRKCAEENRGRMYIATKTVAKKFEFPFRLITLIWFSTALLAFSFFDVEAFSNTYIIAICIIAVSLVMTFRIFDERHNTDVYKKWRSKTYQQFNLLVDEYAKQFIACGVRPNNTVWVLWRDNQKDRVVAMVCGLMRAGGAFVLIDPRATGFQGLLKVLRNTPPDFVLASDYVCVLISAIRCFFSLPQFQFITSTKLNNGITKCVAEGSAFNICAKHVVSQATIAGIMFTSGSTGLPKTVMLSQSVLYNQALAYGRLIRESIVNRQCNIKEIRIMQTTYNFPLFDFVNGFISILPDGDFNNVQNLNVEHLLSTIEFQNVHAGFMSPSVWKRLLNYCEFHNQKFPKSVRFTASGGSPLHPVFHERMMKVFTASFGEHISVYAMTEGLPLASIGSREVLEDCVTWTKIGGGICLGKPVKGLKVQIQPFFIADESALVVARDLRCPHVDTIISDNALSRAFGEICLSGNVMAVKSGGHHKTGDVGYIDLKGRIWLCGRKSHIIRTISGHIVCSVALEAIAKFCSPVKECALLVCPKSKNTILFVEPKLQGIGKWLANHSIFQLQSILALHKVLKYIDKIYVLRFGDSLPTDPRHKSKIIRSWSRFEKSLLSFQESFDFQSTK
eukprot:g2847.t1